MPAGGSPGTNGGREDRKTRGMPGVGDGQGQGIGFVIGGRRGREGKQDAHHVLDLLLPRASGSGDRRLHDRGFIPHHPQPRFRRREHRNPPPLADGNGGRGILPGEHGFDGGDLRTVRGDFLLETQMDLDKPIRDLIAFGMNGA